MPYKCQSVRGLSFISSNPLARIFSPAPPPHSSQGQSLRQNSPSTPVELNLLCLFSSFCRNFTLSYPSSPLGRCTANFVYHPPLQDDTNNFIIFPSPPSFTTSLYQFSCFLGSYKPFSVCIIRTKLLLYGSTSGEAFIPRIQSLARSLTPFMIPITW